MTSGPPPGEAEPSNYHSTSQSNLGLPVSDTTSSNLSSGQIYTGSFQTHTSASTYYPSVQPSGHPLQNGAQNHALCNYPQTWNRNWPLGYSYPQAHPSAFPYAPHPPALLSTGKTIPAEPRPVTPPPPYHKHWDEAIKGFLVSAGLSQALRGFEADMIVMNEEHEQKVVPLALNQLRVDIERIQDIKPETSEENSLDERKLTYIHPVDGTEPRTPTSVTKTISRFLAQNRARNDASNRQEFLLSLAEKRQRLSESGETADPGPSCARTDAKTQNRDIQMKYDIAKNEDGPLRKTMKTSVEADNSNVSYSRDHIANDGIPTVAQYPALDGRLKDVETHLAVKYVPSPPCSLLDRLRFVEDHIVHLEKEYPPWAALHFNQPRRGWPPPPRPTPIIVPSHLTSTTHGGTKQPMTPTMTSNIAPTDQSNTIASNGKTNKGKSTGRQKSSLHRAVMERLEVQKAMNDLTGNANTEDSMDGPE